MDHSKHIILGDVHLGKGLGIGKSASAGKLNSRIQDQLNLLEWTLQTALQKDVNHIIITGDIYEEPRPHPALIRFFMSWLKKCEKHGIKVDIVVGNHDIVKTGNYTVSALDIIPAVELPSANIYKNVETVHYDGISFTFLPYRDRRMYDAENPDAALKMLLDELKDEPSKIPDGNIKVLIGHLSLVGSIYVGDEIDDMLNEIFCPLTSFKEWDYVWMGHVHKPQVMFDKPYIAHVGSMDRSDFNKNETDHDKIIIFIDSESDSVFEEITIPTRPLCKITISVPEGKDTTDFVINELYFHNSKKPLKDSIVRIEVQLNGSDALNSDRDKINKFIYEKLEAHNVCAFIESRNVSVISASTQTLFDNNVSVTSAIDTYFDATDFSSDDERNAVKQLAYACYEDLKQKKVSDEASLS